MTSLPLIVDLDGTVIRTDTLFESSNKFIFSRPGALFQLLSWGTQGKPKLKHNLSLNVSLEPDTLPYNEFVLDYIRESRDAGRKVILATASNQAVAMQIAQHLGLFDEVVASSKDLNLKSSNKADVLVERYGVGGFEYVGDSHADVNVWNVSGLATLVPSAAKYQKFINSEVPLKVLSAPRGRGKLSKFSKMMRLHQWAKNLLIFLPLLVSHEFFNGSKLVADFIAFITFGLAASAIYIVNDLIDVQNDRAHTSKRKRMFASGSVSLVTGWSLWPMLLIGSFVLALIALPLEFALVLSIYVVTTLAYSLRLKRVAVLDVVILAGLYTLRIVAGAAAISVPLSFWIMTFSLFLFLSLALMKRFSELKELRELASVDQIRGRGYVAQDLELVSSLGAASGLIAVLVFMLYVQDTKVASLYSSPAILWLTGPVLLIWIARAWLIAHRGDMHDDPIVFAIRDRMSYLVGVCVVLVFIFAMVY